MLTSPFETKPVMLKTSIIFRLHYQIFTCFLSRTFKVILDSFCCLYIKFKALKIVSINYPEMAKFPPLLRLLIFVPFQRSGRCKKLYAEYKVNIYYTKVTFVTCLICIDVWCIVFWVINILPKKEYIQCLKRMMNFQFCSVS